MHICSHTRIYTYVHMNMYTSGREAVVAELAHLLSRVQGRGSQPNLVKLRMLSMMQGGTKLSDYMSLLPVP